MILASAINGKVDKNLFVLRALELSVDKELNNYLKYTFYPYPIEFKYHEWIDYLNEIKKDLKFIRETDKKIQKVKDPVDDSAAELKRYRNELAELSLLEIDIWKRLKDNMSKVAINLY